jgi:hypothetical protein
VGAHVSGKAARITGADSRPSTKTGVATFFQPVSEKHKSTPIFHDFSSEKLPIGSANPIFDQYRVTRLW